MKWNIKWSEFLDFYANQDLECLDFYVNQAYGNWNRICDYWNWNKEFSEIKYEHAIVEMKNYLSS